MKKVTRNRENNLTEGGHTSIFPPSNSPLSEQKNIIASILDSIDAFIHVVDTATLKIMFVNQYGKKVWGDITGQPCWKILHQDRSGPCPDCINRHLIDDSGNPIGVHVWEYLSSADNRWYDCRGRSIRLPDGRLITVKIATDVTERKRAEEELSRYAERLEKIREMDNAILSNNTPKDISRKALRHLRGLVPGERASVLIFDPDARVCTILAVDEDGKTNIPEGTKLHIDDVLTPEDLMEGHITVEHDIRSAAGKTGIEELLLRNGYRSYIRAPMRIGDKMIGSLNIGSTVSHMFSPEHVEITREVATTLALAIKQAQLKEQIEKHSMELERKMEERTGELELVNRALTDELNERRRAINELRESEERYRTSIESSNDGVAIVRGDKIVFTNNKYNEIFGYDDPREILGKDISITIHPDDSAMVTRRNAMRQKGKDVPSKYEFKGIKKDGTMIHVETSATSINYRGETATLVYLRDITEKKRAEDALQASEKQYRNLVENSLVGVYQADVEGNILYVNEAFAKMLGFDSVEEAININIVTRYKDRRKWMDLVKTLRKAKKIPAIEVELLTSSGEARNILLSATLENNTLSGMAEDITSRKKAEVELREKSQSIEEVNAALKVLLKQRERDKDEMEQKILGNVKELILPYIDKLRSVHTTEKQRTYIDIIESNIRNIVSPFMQKMSTVNMSFTPTEVKVAAFIRDDKTVKEISTILGVSVSAVNLHRQHIRNKLGLNGKKINLRTFLLSLQ